MENNKQAENQIQAIKKPKRPIIIKIFLSFVLFSIFTIIANSFLIIWTFQKSQLNITDEELKMLISDFQNNFIFVVILIIIPAIFLSIRIAEDIARPVRLIMKNIKEISLGNLNINIPTKRKDEFGIIINLFNEMTAKLKTVKERDEEISKIKSNFVTVASHQLRTPVSGVRWGLDMLSSELKGPLNQDQKDIVNKCIERNNETIKNIDDLLNTSQIEENNFLYEMQETMIGALLEKTLKNFETQSKIKNRKIVFENKLKEDIKLFIDPYRIHTVFSNIIDNAFNYGTKDTDIEISLLTEGEFVLIQIANYGMNIPKIDQEKMFKKFFRSENAILTKPNGIGLGLYICKKIINYHKGKIVLFSNEESSKTIFSIYLPIPQSLITEKPKVEEFLESF